MTVIDLHAHALPLPLLQRLAADHPAVAPSVRSEAGRWHLTYPNGQTLGPFPPGIMDIDARLADMDRQGVDVQAVSIAPSHFFYELPPAQGAELAALHNDGLLDMARSAPKRFVALGNLPLQDPPAAAAEVDRLAGHAEVVGVQIGTHVAGANLDDPDLMVVWEALARVGFVVLIHPHAPAGIARLRPHYLVNLVGFPAETAIAAGALLFGGVLHAQPSLRFCLVHGGGFLPYQIARFDHGWSLRADLRQRLPEPPSQAARRFYYDSLTHGSAALAFLIAQVGVDQVVLGSDYPFGMGAKDPVTDIREHCAEAEVAAAVLQRNPQRLLTRNAV